MSKKNRNLSVCTSNQNTIHNIQLKNHRKFNIKMITNGACNLLLTAFYTMRIICFATGFDSQL